MAEAGALRRRRPLPPVPALDQVLGESEEQVAGDRPETYWSLVWRKFRRHRLAVVGAAIAIFFYVTCVVLADFVAPYSLEYQHRTFKGAPPQRIRFVDSEGRFHFRPFVYGYKREVNPVTFERIYTPDPAKVYPIHFFVRAEEYRLFGLVPANIRFFGTQAENGHVFLLGTDRLGRDMFSRIFYGGRASLTLGLVGTLLSLFLGAVMGTMSGYYGGWLDNVIQRGIEVLISFPSLPLWMTLAAAVPPRMSPYTVYFLVTLILSLISWGHLARQIRGMVLSLRERDFIMAARGIGAGDARIIFRHLLPNTASHMIVITTLAIPGMILGETALSYLGLGLRPPLTSWGVLLQEAQQVRVLAEQPWLVAPVLPVAMFIMSVYFLGDGLRDAADPYSK